MHLQSFTLQIFETERTLKFYTEVLGFRLLEKYRENKSTFFNLYLDGSKYFLQLKFTELLERKPYQEDATDNYWKYSLFVTDLEKNYSEIQQKKWSISTPFQFGKIGYLSHTQDSENHQIEFIQKSFKDNSVLKTALGNVLGLITIRTKDPLKTIRFYETILDLKLFVRMYVNRNKGFTLYFLGNKELDVPNLDIDAIENREWMYQQDHLFIEIQHYWGSEFDDDFHLSANDNNGLQSINFTGDTSILENRLRLNNIAYKAGNNRIVFQTIDKHIISVNRLKQ